MTARLAVTLGALPGAVLVAAAWALADPDSAVLVGLAVWWLAAQIVPVPTAGIGRSIPSAATTAQTRRP